MTYTQITLTASATKNYQKAEVTLNVVLDNPNDTIEAAQSYVNTLAIRQLEELNSRIVPATPAPAAKAPYAPTSYATPAPKTNYASPNGYAPRGARYPVSDGQRSTLKKVCHMSDADIDNIPDYKTASTLIKEHFGETQSAPAAYRSAPVNNGYGYAEDEYNGRR